MLCITIPETSVWDEEIEEFLYLPEITINLEHSLKSLSKWESFYEKPFLSTEDKTAEEWMYYIKCMTIPDELPISYYSRLTSQNINEIRDYIDKSMSAFRWNGDGKKSRSREKVTAETIYYCMITYNIPMSCENWHLNRLRALLDMFSMKNQPEEKVPLQEKYRRNRELNEARKAKYKTKG